MSEVIKPLSISDSHSMWLINEQGLPGTGQVTTVEMEKLVQLSEICLGAFTDEKLIGFVLCLLPNVNYSSLNYAWFNDRYDEFIYVDRVAVATDARNQGIGSMLYQKVFDYAQANDLPVTAEVSLKPPNPGSDRFHLRHGFARLDEFSYGDKAVTMYIKQNTPPDD